MSVTGSVAPRAMVRLEVSGALKNPITSSAAEPATLRLVAYFLNQLHYRVYLLTSCIGPINPIINPNPVYNHYRVSTGASNGIGLN
jgi:hypothetical protein